MIIDNALTVFCGSSDCQHLSKRAFVRHLYAIIMTSVSHLYAMYIVYIVYAIMVTYRHSAWLSPVHDIECLHGSILCIMQSSIKLLRPSLLRPINHLLAFQSL